MKNTTRFAVALLAMLLGTAVVSHASLQSRIPAASLVPGEPPNPGDGEGFLVPGEPPNPGDGEGFLVPGEPPNPGDGEGFLVPGEPPNPGDGEGF